MENKDITTKPVTATPAGAPVNHAAAPGGAPFAPRRNSTRRPPMRENRERVKPEFDTKIINIRRVTRVASGGRRFSFSVAVVSGDRKGHVGVGLGKAGDTSLAIDKATRNAKKNMIKVNLLPTMSIAHPVESKYSSAIVTITPAKGRGVVAGSSVRNVIELAGVKDVVAKLLSGTKNKLNNARAAVDALSQLSKSAKPARLSTHAKIVPISK
jgi:small subunit ribosomal protein S5